MQARATAATSRDSILVIDDDPLVADVVRAALEPEGFAVVATAGGGEGILAALEHEPSLIILDVLLPDMDGLAVCRQLRGHGKTGAIPIIMLSALDRPDQRVAGLNGGADDYITKPFYLPELLARIRTQLRHVANNQRSELTGLPGNTLIERAIRAELARGGDDLSILYVDLDDFKAYNDTYGFLAGNTLIKLVAAILRQVVQQYDRDSGFCGHVGGDDFVVVTRCRDVEGLCRAIIARFEEERGALYGPADRARGYIVATDRGGRPRHFPLARLSIGVVTTRRRALKDEWEVSHIAADVKKKAKSLAGSSFYIDQRAAF